MAGVQQGDRAAVVEHDRPGCPNACPPDPGGCWCHCHDTLRDKVLDDLLQRGKSTIPIGEDLDVTIDFTGADA